MRKHFLSKQDRYDCVFKGFYGTRPEITVSECPKANDPIHLLDSVDKDQLKSFRFYIDCSDDDFLYKGNSALHVKMRDLGIPHKYRVCSGAPACLAD
ncbi:MAG: hypothetical protein ACK5M7_15390 [Draconibacterium sp.]